MNFFDKLVDAFSNRRPGRRGAKTFGIGWISSYGSADGSLFLTAFQAALRDLGYLAGRDFSVEPRWSEREGGEFARFAAQLAKAKLDVIVSQGTLTLGPMLATRCRTPIAFAFNGDVVEAGFVTDLDHPDRNCTGIMLVAPEHCVGQVELLREIMLGLKRIAVLANPLTPGNQADLRALESSMRANGITLEYFQARTPAELEKTLLAIPGSGSQAILALPTAFALHHRSNIAEFAISNRLPLASNWGIFAESGFFLTYGTDLKAAYRRLAVYVDRILRGARPADLPVEIPATRELVVNLETARRIGVSVPQSILQRADRVVG